MSFAYSYIDYNDMISELKDDLDQGFVSEDSELYIIRQNTPVTLSSSSEVFYPVLDYLYMEPELRTDLVSMTIADAKREFYSLKETVTSETYLQILSEILNSLSEYTHGRSKRNDEKILVVYTKESGLPFTFFFENDDANDELETIAVKELLQELECCNQN